MKKRRLLALTMAAAMTFSFAACNDTGNKDNSGNSSGGGSSDKPKIGVSMPTKSLQRWNQDGSNMKEQLEKSGYEVDLQYAGDNEISMQVSQVENMITGGCDVIVIASIDGSSLTEALKGAKEKNIPVIAYDRLIMNSDAVKYYATFDNYLVGKTQGEYIRDALDLENKDGPFNIELFTGSADDNNVNFFFGGAMDVLKPYIDSGKLVVPSKQTTKDQCATENWSSEKAQSRMENLITSQGYGPDKKKLDAVLCSNDSVSLGVQNALKSAGYTADNHPVVTGQDCDKPNVKNIKEGMQNMSIFKDTRLLANKALAMIDAVVKGTEPEVNNTTDYDNGTGKIPSYLCQVETITKDNYQAKLIDSGYYTEADIA